MFEELSHTSSRIAINFVLAANAELRPPCGAGRTDLRITTTKRSELITTKVGRAYLRQPVHVLNLLSNGLGVVVVSLDIMLLLRDLLPGAVWWFALVCRQEDAGRKGLLHRCMRKIWLLHSETGERTLEHADLH